MCRPGVIKPEGDDTGCGTIQSPGNRPKVAFYLHGYIRTYTNWNQNGWNVPLWSQKQSADCGKEERVSCSM